MQDEACAAGDGKACVELGTRYHSGLGVERSTDRALGLFHRACTAGLAAGCTHEALALVTSGSAEADSRAATLLASSCEFGDARACGALGALVEMGRGGTAGPDRALELHRKACASGYEASCERVSTIEGRAVESRVEGWGELVDPSGASRVTTQDTTLVIDVPGGPYDLSVEIAEMAAPRLLQSVEGDFVAEVSVLTPLRPGKDSAIPGTRAAFNGAGLLLWIDGGNYVRLEAAALMDLDGGRQVYTLFELRTRGRLTDFGRTAGRGAGPPIDLKIERSGWGLRAYYRRRGSDWKRAGQIRGKFPRRMQVGVAAVNTSRSPLHVELEGFRVVTTPSSEQPGSSTRQ